MRPRGVAAGVVLGLAALPPASHASQAPVHVIKGAGLYGLSPAAFTVDAVHGAAGGVVTFVGPVFAVQALVGCSALVVEPFPLRHTFYGSGPSSLGGMLYFTFKDSGTAGIDEVAMSTSNAGGPCGAPPNPTQIVYGQIMIGP